MSAQAQKADVVIVGGGAAGLAAAIFCAQAAPGKHVVILERSAKIGAKILISGGGRCNVTNATVRPQDFNGPQTVIRNILAAFDEHATVDWFASLGVPLKQEETDKLFPVSDRAATVVEALLSRCRALGVTILHDHLVNDIGCDEGFVVQCPQASIAAPVLVLATGGRSLPRTGSDGLGWQIVTRLGHSVTETYPALVPLVLRSTFFHAALSGLSHTVELSTFVDGKLADRRYGSLLFTHFGISGPVVLDASRHWVLPHTQGRDVELRCNALPQETFASVEQQILAATQTSPRKSLLRHLTRNMPERLALELLRVAAIDPTTPLAQLSRMHRRTLLHTLIELTLPVERARGWDYAEVTAGGVPLGEVNFRTMESRKQPGLYLIGEMLDCDGRIGGFNFQWAWTTGYLAGRAAAQAAPV